MKARNIWTKRFGSDRRFTNIGLGLFKDAGRARWSDIEPSFASVF
jgi:hypothetical protein